MPRRRVSFLRRCFLKVLTAFCTSTGPHLTGRVAAASHSFFLPQSPSPFLFVDLSLLLFVLFFFDLSSPICLFAFFPARTLFRAAFPFYVLLFAMRLFTFDGVFGRFSLSFQNYCSSLGRIFTPFVSVPHVRVFVWIMTGVLLARVPSL